MHKASFSYEGGQIYVYLRIIIKMINNWGKNTAKAADYMDENGPGKSWLNKYQILSKSPLFISPQLCGCWSEIVGKWNKDNFYQKIAGAAM